MLPFDKSFVVPWDANARHYNRNCRRTFLYLVTFGARRFVYYYLTDFLFHICLKMFRYPFYTKTQSTFCCRSLMRFSFLRTGLKMLTPKIVAMPYKKAPKMEDLPTFHLHARVLLDPLLFYDNDYSLFFLEYPFKLPNLVFTGRILP